MSEDASKMTCEEFQNQIGELNASGADLENHPHVKACVTCCQLVQELEIIAEAARKLFPPEWSEINAVTERFTGDGMESNASIAIALYLADLLRENARLHAENHSLGAILRSAVQHREIPKGWSAVLKRMRTTPEYREVSSQHDSIITQLEKSATTRDIRQILANRATSRRVN